MLAFIDNGTDISLKDEIGCTALHEAFVYEQLDLVEKLLDQGADINAQDAMGRTPLHNMAASGKLNEVQIL